MPVQNPLLKFHSSFNENITKLREWPIVGFDSEDDSRGTVTLFGFFSDNGGYVTKNHEKAIDYIYNLETAHYFVAHNLEYDFVNFFKHSKYDYIDEMIYAGNKLLKFTLKGCAHVFIDSSSFFRGNLRSMGKFVGLKKLDGNAYDEKYVERDAEICYTFMKEFQRTLVHDEGVNLGITIGQMAMALYRRNYMTSKKQITYNSPNCLEAFYGGRTEAFYLGILKHGVKASDINSCYPDQMKNNDFPDTSCIEPSSIKTHKFGIGHFKVHVPEDMFIPPLPYKDKKTGRLFFPVGTFTGWWTYAEINYAISLGVEILEEYAGEGTNNSCRPFEGFITDYYDKRLLAKASGDKFKDLLYKLWQNNLYGKWVQHQAGGIMTREKLPMYKIEPYLEHPDFETKKLGDFYWYKIPKLEPPKTANFMWGVYVTSYSRIKLHKGLMAVHKAGYTPVYTDTDSIMYTELPTDFVTNRTPLPLSKKLGDWDLEEFDLGIFRQAKAYMLYNHLSSQLSDKEPEYHPVKVACKGVPVAYAHDFVIEAFAKFEKPYRFKESLIRATADSNLDKGDDFLKEMQANIWAEAEKSMRSVYVKRSGTEGVTFPQNVNDIENVLKASVKPYKLDFSETVNNAGVNLLKTVDKNKFIRKDLPKDFFNEEWEREYSGTINVNRRGYRLSYDNCIDLKSGDTWFSGDILRLVYFRKGEIYPVEEPDPKSKTKYYYQVLVRKFKGKVAVENFLCEIRSSILEYVYDHEDLINKNVDVKLLSKYNGVGFPVTGIEVKGSDLFALEKEEELDLDFSFLENMKQKLTN